MRSGRHDRQQEGIEKREVALELNTAQAVTLLSRLAGDRLASHNLDKLHDGDRVRIVIQ